MDGMEDNNLMKDNIKIYHVQGETNYSNWIPNITIVDTIEEADLVLFEGGEDVDPSLYNEPEHRSTYSNIERDIEETAVFEKAKELNIPCLGVCRGSQFLCVMSGGKLVQDQPNPRYIHDMLTEDGLVIKVSSTHHQAQYPFNMIEGEDYKLLGWTENLLPYHQNGFGEELSPVKECEVVYYPKTNCLGIQPHPEMLWDKWQNAPEKEFEETIDWFRKVLFKFLNKEI